MAIRGVPFKFTGRRLNPGEIRQVKLLMERALPKRLPAEVGTGEDRYDFEDPDYRSRKEESRRAGRALALWLGYPVFKADWEAAYALANPPDAGQIAAFIEGLSMDDEVLEVLLGALTLSVVSVTEFTGFISGSSSPKS